MSRYARGTTDADAPVDDRHAAQRRVLARREFTVDIVSYVVVNLLLIGIWALTGAGYFWPIWVIGGWGVGVALHVWNVFLRAPVTDADIDAELQRRRR